jgi:hypothetical protein
VYSERTQHVLIQESVGILDMEPPCTKHILSQYREVCPQCLEGKDILMEDMDAKGEPLDSSSDLDPVENVVAIPIPGPSVVHTLVPVETPSEFIPPSLHVTPSPPYVAEHVEDLEHSGVPEFWVDPEVNQ